MRFGRLILSTLMVAGAAVSSSAGTAPHFANGTTSTGWIDFELQGGKRIFIPAKINGHDAMVLLASGLPVSDIDRTFAESIGLHKNDGSATSAANGSDSGNLIRGVRIEIGNMALQDTSASLVDFAPLAKHIGHELPLLLGDDAFNQASVDIDFAHHRIAFSKPGSQPRPEGAIEVPLTRVDGTPLVPVSIEGAPPAQFELGIGNSGEALVYQSYYDAHHLLDSRQTSKRLAAGTGGFIIEPVAELRRVQFAGITFTKMPAAFIPASQTGTTSPVIAGDLGLPILSRFRLIIDYTNAQVYAVPNGDVTQLPLPKDRLGMFLARQNDGIAIKFVAPDSPALKAGLKVGDTIVAIDGKPAQSWSETSLEELRYRASGSCVSFAMQDGSVRSVKLADYF
jgi:PDZ domain/Aspartyl protease